MSTMEPTFTVLTIQCDVCHETFQGKNIEEIKAEHRETHRQGRCGKCGHWRKAHLPVTEEDKGYFGDQDLVCMRPMGMGDFCGCSGEE